LQISDRELLAIFTKAVEGCVKFCRGNPVSPAEARLGIFDSLADAALGPLPGAVLELLLHVIQRCQVIYMDIGFEEMGHKVALFRHKSQYVIHRFRAELIRGPR
jgi:hypothetical protein